MMSMLARRPFIRPPFMGNARLRRLGQGFDPSMFPGAQGMPAMNAVQQLAQNGAILNVEVSSPSGGAPVTIKAMIDTGASITTIHSQIAESAGLQPVGQTQLSGVGGVQMSTIYAAAVTLPDYSVTMNPVQVASIPGGLPGIDMLIGRDMLMYMTMTYQGSQGAFQLVQDATPPTTVANPATPGTLPGAGPMVQNLPQPPKTSNPWLWIGGGVAATGLIVGSLFLFKVF